MPSEEPKEGILSKIKLVLGLIRSICRIIHKWPAGGSSGMKGVYNTSNTGAAGPKNLMYSMYYTCI